MVSAAGSSSVDGSSEVPGLCCAAMSMVGESRRGGALGVDAGFSLVGFPVCDALVCLGLLSVFVVGGPLLHWSVLCCVEAVGSPVGGQLALLGSPSFSSSCVSGGYFRLKKGFRLEVCGSVDYGLQRVE